jgi:uncharacterized protein
MKTVRLGKTELMVSELGFGGIPIIPIGFEDSVAVVTHCFEQGITFYDTANAYADSEKKIGAALESVREKVIIATKTSMRDAEGAAKHINFSLENLNTDYIDLYQFHNISSDEELEKILAPNGAMEAVTQAVDSGKIRHVGFSSHKIETSIKTCQTGLFSTIQFPFNFIENEPLDELFITAQDLDMGIIAMKPLGGGLLERADLCFKFLQQYPYVVPIPGIMYQKEIDEILSLYKSPKLLNDTDLKDIEGIRGELGKEFCHRCRYCLPCDQDVKIPEILGFRSMKKRIPPAAIAIAQAAMTSVDNCTECEECIDKCPYDLGIPLLIRRHREQYDEFVASQA